MKPHKHPETRGSVHHMQRAVFPQYVEKPLNVASRILECNRTEIVFERDPECLCNMLVTKCARVNWKRGENGLWNLFYPSSHRTLSVLEFIVEPFSGSERTLALSENRETVCLASGSEESRIHVSNSIRSKFVTINSFLNSGVAKISAKYRINILFISL